MSLSRVKKSKPVVIFFYDECGLLGLGKVKAGQRYLKRARIPILNKYILYA